MYKFHTKNHYSTALLFSVAHSGVVVRPAVHGSYRRDADKKKKGMQ